MSKMLQSRVREQRVIRSLGLMTILIIILALLPELSHAQADAWAHAGLASLPQLDPEMQTRMVSPENPTGEKGKGAMTIPNPKDPDLPFSEAAIDLGQGWKVRPFLRVQPHTTVTIMDVDGPAVIQHLWMIISPTMNLGRATVLRFYWDGEEQPSVESPTTDFFAIGHDTFATVNSLPIVDVPKKGLNCYWPMPFRKHVKITFTNDSDEVVQRMSYQIDYQQTTVSSQVAYFHAQWRRQVVSRTNPDYTILDNVKGEGRYVGTFLAFTQLSSGWFGEGEVKFFLDGDGKFPTTVGTGTEDYFGGSLGFPETYTTAYIGAPLHVMNADGPPKWSLYRWHIMDPINFHSDLKVTIQDLGWWPGHKKYQPLADDIASVAFWYQREPHSPFLALPPVMERWPR